MLLAVTSSVPTVLETFWGENPLEKAVTFLRMPSQTPIRTRKGAFDPTRKKGGGSLPPLTPLLISQTRMANGKTDLLFAICLGPGPGDKILN
jgi:hypothetical protein